MILDLSNVWPEWEIIEKIGRGTYGTVYEAKRKDNAIESHAAIKVISFPAEQGDVAETDPAEYDEEARADIISRVKSTLKEIQLLEQFKGVQNIVNVEDYKVVEKKDRFGFDIYIRMELLTPLLIYFKNRKITESEIIRLGIDMCSALELCENSNIIHRDIKPENIFVNSFGNFKLGDFGVARSLENADGTLSQKGTFNYMAPEIVKGERYDATVDIYSLGLVLYRFANNNNLPFIGDSARMLEPAERQKSSMRRIKGEELPRPCGASPEFAQLILTACSYDPQNRFRTAKAMKAALTNVSNIAASKEKTSRNPQNYPKQNRNQGRESEQDYDKTISVRSPGRMADDRFAGYNGNGRTADDRFAGYNGNGRTADDRFAGYNGNGRMADDRFAGYNGNRPDDGYRQNSRDYAYDNQTESFGNGYYYDEPQENKKNVLPVILLIIAILIALFATVNFIILPAAGMDPLISITKETHDSTGEEGKVEEETAALEKNTVPVLQTETAAQAETASAAKAENATTMQAEKTTTAQAEKTTIAQAETTTWGSDNETETEKATGSGPDQSAVLSAENYYIKELNKRFFYIADYEYRTGRPGVSLCDIDNDGVPELLTMQTQYRIPGNYENDAVFLGYVLNVVDYSGSSATSNDAGSYNTIAEYNSTAGSSAVSLASMLKKLADDGASLQESTIQYSSSQYMVYDCFDGLRMKSGPSPDYSRIVTVPDNTILTISEIVNGWGRTTYGSYSGWVCMEYTMAVGTSSAQAPSQLSSASTKTVTCSYDGTKLRVSPSQSSSAFATIPNGTVITVKAYQNGWYYAEYNGLSGWVNGSALY